MQVRVPLRPELDDVQQALKNGLFLVVAPGCADRHERLAVLQHDARRQRVARPRARTQLGRARLVEPERLSANAHHDARGSEDDGRREPGTARCAVEHIAVAVDDRNMRRVLDDPGGGIVIARHGRRRHGIGKVRDPVRPRLHLGIERQRVAGQVAAGRAARIDLRGTLLRVSLRQQTLGGTLDECLVGIVAVAIGVGELQRFDHRVDVVRAVPPHRLEVELLQDVQRFEQHGALAAERVLVNLVPSIGRHRGLFDLGEELREVVELPGRVVLLQEGDHLARDVSLVEPVASGGDPGGPAPPGRTALGI